MAIANAVNMTSQICASLGSQLGEMFECMDAGERVQIRTPFVYPDGDLIDLYWSDTGNGQVVSDLGDTYGWLFINGGNDGLTTAQNRAYDDACLTYGVGRRDGVLLVTISDGRVAEAVIQLAQAITMISQVLDLAQPSQNKVSERQKTADRVLSTIRPFRSFGWRYRRNVQMRGRYGRDWQLDFIIETPHAEAALMALHGRKYRGWQRRAIANAFTAFSDLAPRFSQGQIPIKPISVIDDIDVSWYEEPIELLATVSQIVRLSRPDSLRAAIDGNGEWNVR